MGDSEDTESLLIERIDVASEIVRNTHYHDDDVTYKNVERGGRFFSLSHPLISLGSPSVIHPFIFLLTNSVLFKTAVAFQRAFFLEVLILDRVINEIDEFRGKVNRLQGKLAVLFNDLQHVENESGASRAASITEKLETLKKPFDDLRKRCTEAKDRREGKSKELNVVVMPDLNIMKIDTMSVKDLRGIRAPSYTSFVNDSDFHLAEEISDEWGKLRRKLDNYFQKYVEDTTSLRVEIFGTTYTNDIHNSEDSSTKGLIHKLSTLIGSRKNSNASNHSTTSSTSHNNNSKSSSQYVRSESFFYCENPIKDTTIETCENKS